MKRWIAVLACALVVAGVALMIAGGVRYGGVTGLLLRVRAEIGAQRPHAAFVPTPLPTAPGQATALPTPPSSDTPTISATIAGAPAPDTRTPRIAPTARAAPTQTPGATWPPPHTPGPTPAAPDALVELTGLSHVWQTWNNCGPATLSMYLSYWGTYFSQEEIRLVVRPNPEDKHAGPQELADVAQAQGLRALVRINGSAQRLRTLLANGLPVMVSTWHEDDPGDGMGHYRLIVGYDDGAGEWLLYDSLAATAADRDAPYEPLRLAYGVFASLWKVFDYRYLLVYPDEMSDIVQAIVAEDMVDQTMWERALEHALGELAEDDQNPFHWFNLGTNLVALGRHQEAASAYDQARQLGLPWRMLWYQFGPFPAYYAVGRYDEVIALADATLAVTQHVEELHYWRAMALAAKGEHAAARAALRRALDLKPGYPEATRAWQDLGE